jgi:hypothetical protein
MLFSLLFSKPNIFQTQARSAGNNSTKSAFWSSVMQVKDILINNCIIQIQKGNSSIWSTPWYTIWKEIHNHLNLPLTIQNLPQKISDLWILGSMNWNADFINQVFDSDAAASFKIPLQFPLIVMMQ